MEAIKLMFISKEVKWLSKCIIEKFYFHQPVSQSLLCYNKCTRSLICRLRYIFNTLTKCNYIYFLTHIIIIIDYLKAIKEILGA